MKRLFIHLVVSLLTFFIGASAAKAPHIFKRSHVLKLPQQAAPAPEQIVLKPSAYASDRFEKIADVPVDDQHDSFTVQFVSEKEGWLSSAERLWRTNDGGESWHLVFDGGHEKPFPNAGFTEPRSIYQFQFINSQVGWLLQYGKMFKTEDGGDSWQPCGEALFEQLKEWPLFAFKFSQDGKHGWIAGGVHRPLKENEAVPNRYYSVDGKKGLFGAVFATKDGGRTWQQQLLASFSGHLPELYFLDTEHAWAVGTAGAYYLKNGRWRKTETHALDKEGNVVVESLNVEIGMPTIAPVEVYFLNSKLGWLSNTGGGMAKSTDGGRTWHDLFNLYDDQEEQDFHGLFFDELYFGDSMKGWGLDSLGAIRETLDGGETWSKIEMNVEFTGMYFLDARHGWAISKEGLFKIIP